MKADTADDSADGNTQNRPIDRRQDGSLGGVGMQMTTRRTELSFG